MQTYWKLFSLIFVYFCIDLGCGEFYMGMFKKNDFLVARDTVFKGKTPYGYTYAKYGKTFPCPITYFSVRERLGANQTPKVQIIRGGLQKKYIVVKMWTYNAPIAVNVLVGCENKKSKVHRTVQKFSEYSESESETHTGPIGKTVVLNNMPSELPNEINEAFDVASEGNEVPSGTTGTPNVPTDDISSRTEEPSVITEKP